MRRTIHTLQEVGPDKVLHLNIPVDQGSCYYKLVITLEPDTPPERQPTPEELGWPPGYFEQTAGRWEGEFVRDQGEYEKREEL